MVKRAALDMQGRPREIEAFSNFPAYRATLRELLPTQMVTEPQNTPSFSVSGR